MLVFILVDGARINEDAMIKYAAQVRMAVKCDDFRVWNCLPVTNY